MSDHCYIFYKISNSDSRSLDSSNASNYRYPRWSWRVCKKDSFTGLVEYRCTGFDAECSVEELAGWFGEVMEEACNLAAKRCTSRANKTAAYWWCDEVARRLCVAARRKWTRSRRRGRNNSNTMLENNYKTAKRPLRSEIVKTKAKAWRN